MASIYRRGKSKVYSVGFTDKSGRHRVRSTGTTNRSAAVRKAQEIIDGVQHAPPTPHSLKKLANLWLSELERLGRSQKHISQRRRATEALGFDVAKANADGSCLVLLIVSKKSTTETHMRQPLRRHGEGYRPQRFVPGHNVPEHLVTLPPYNWPSRP